MDNEFACAETTAAAVRFRAMNTDVDISLDCEPESADALLDWSEDWFRSSERRFSRFVPDSELSRLNEAGGARTFVSAAMLEVLLLAERYRLETEGIFNYFVLDALEKAGYRRSFELLGNGETVCADKTAPISEAFAEPPEIDRAMRTVRFRSGQHIDLGGIVKGWTAERLAGWLQNKWMVPRGMVNAGGDLIVWGEPEAGSPWQIGVAHPWNEQADIARLSLYRGAVATSSIVGRSWQTDQGIMHHVIDPRTMSPSQSDVVQCTVAGASVVQCEVWSKVVIILGSEAGSALFREKLPAGEALFVTRDGAVHFCGRRASLRSRWHGLQVDVFHETD